MIGLFLLFSSIHLPNIELHLGPGSLHIQGVSGLAGWAFCNPQTPAVLSHAASTPFSLQPLLLWSFPRGCSYCGL